MDDLLFHHALNPDFYELACNFTHCFADENELCGDSMEMELEICDDIIRNASFSGEMCMMSKAGADILLKYAIGKTVEQAKQVTEDQVLDLISRQSIGSRRGCFLFGLKVFRNVLLTEIS